MALLALGALAVVGARRAMESRFVADRRAELHLRRARAAVAARAYDEARSEFRSALRLSPGDLGARRELAAMELGLGHTELAFVEYQSLTEMHPEEPAGWIRVAELMRRSGLLEAPEAALDKAIETAPRNAEARLARADIRSQLGRYRGAVDDARAAVDAEPTLPEAWELLITATARAEGASAGVEIARQAPGPVRDFPPVLLALASLLGQSGRENEARDLLDREITGAPAGSERAWTARLARARLELLTGTPRTARPQIDALGRERPADERVVALLAVAEALGGDLEGALARLQTAIAARPSGLLLSVREELQRARDRRLPLSGRLALTTDPLLGSPPAPPRRVRPDAQIDRGNLGAWTREYWPGRMGEIRKSFEAQLQKHDWTEAQRLVDAASSEFPGSAFGPFLAGLLALHRGDLEQAGRHLSAALEIAPRSPVLVATLGRVWSAKGGAAFAAGQLMTLASRDPKLSLVRYMAARAFIEAGDPIRAEAALRRGLELQPDSPVPYQHLTDYEFGVDRVPEGLEVAREGVTRFPQATDLQMMLGQIEAALGQPRPAIQTYETLLSRRPDLDLARYRLALLLAPQSDPALRARFLQTLALLRNDRPSDPQLLDALGWMQHQAGHDAEARNLLETAVEHSPDDPSVRFHLGTVLLALGDTARGRQELQHAVDSPRQFPERLEAMRLVRQEPPPGRGSADSPRH